MREIKFRAWDGEKMIYPSIIGTPPYESFAWAHDRSWLHNCQEWDGDEGFINNPILMQYTGLKDKNGKEIYEGDIVSMYTFDSSPVPFEVRTSVSFHEGSFVAIIMNGEPISLRDAILVSNKAKQGLELIGNLYENPELLK